MPNMISLLGNVLMMKLSSLRIRILTRLQQNIHLVFLLESSQLLICLLFFPILLYSSFKFLSCLYLQIKFLSQLVPLKRCMKVVLGTLHYLH